MANSKSKQIPFEITPEIKSDVLKLIAESSEPLKAADLIKSAGLPKKLTGKALQSSLEQEVESGQIFNWGTKAISVYWHRKPKAEARERLLSLAASELLDAAKLSARSMAGPPKLSKATVAGALKELQTEERFRLITPAGSKTKQVVNLEHPEPYLAAEIARLLQSFGRQQLIEPMSALLSHKPLPESASPTMNTDVQEVAAKMFEAMNRIAFSPGTTVTFYRLRQQLELADVPKEIFDKAALLLEHERKALLSFHDHAAALPAEQREQFVTDGLGTYYVSIYAR
jgi:hypothetical protein